MGNRTKVPVRKPHVVNSMIQGILDKLTVVELLKKFPFFRETLKFIIMSNPDTSIYPGPAQFTPRRHTLFY
jgi:hypothetical protein